jgi:hypothetical protein
MSHRAAPRGAVAAAALLALAGPVAARALDGALIEKLTGAHGRLDPAEGVFKVSVPRTDLHVVAGGVRIVPEQGLVSWAAFAGSDGRAVVDGDFAVLEGELQPVPRALRAAGIGVVAIHQHMTGEEPRLLFLHYWGIGPAASLARGLRAALDRTGGAPKAL